jgi:hypothetical protein
MTFDLSSIKPTRKNTPTRILVYGESKVGKSVFASQADGVIFIPTEDGQDNIDTEAFPLCQSWQDVLSCVTTLYMEEHKYRTVVLDTADWAETLAHKKVVDDIDKAKVTSIEHIGYGKGYTFAADLFRELLDGFNALRQKKEMQIIILCHTEIRRFDDPMTDSYDRWQIKLHRLISKMMFAWVDVIGFAQKDSATRTENQGFDKTRTRAIDIDRRVLRLQGSVAFDAGCRYDLPATVPLIWSEFQEVLDKAKQQG